MAHKKTINIITKYIQFLIENGITINKALLYGSYSKGTENIESDIDIMLISEQFDNYNDRQIGKLWRITKTFNYRIEPYIVGLKKFNNDDVSPIIQIVKKDGIEILLDN